MLATLVRNLDADAAGKPELEHAPINNDKVESDFAILDRILPLGAGMNATMAVSHAQALKAFISDAAKRELARSHLMKRKRESGSEWTDADVEKEFERMSMTSFWNLDEDLRWSIYCEVRRKYSDLCVKEPREKKEEHDAAAVKRMEVAHSKEIARRQNFALKHAKHSAIVPCTNADELAALRITYANDKDYVEALRDQIRLRHHVYGIAPGVLPQIGSTPANTTELARLEGELQAEARFHLSSTA